VEGRKEAEEPRTHHPEESRPRPSKKKGLVVGVVGEGGLPGGGVFVYIRGGPPRTERNPPNRGGRTDTETSLEGGGGTELKNIFITVYAKNDWGGVLVRIWMGLGGGKSGVEIGQSEEGGGRGRKTSGWELVGFLKDGQSFELGVVSEATGEENAFKGRVM